jgi:hypothetical protein
VVPSFVHGSSHTMIERLADKKAGKALNKHLNTRQLKKGDSSKGTDVVSKKSKEGR